MKLLKLVISISCLLGVSMANAKGAVKTDFQYEPLQIYKEVEPGKVFTQAVKVTNVTNNNLTTQLNIEPAYINPEGLISTLDKFKKAKIKHSQMPFLGFKNFQGMSEAVEIPAKGSKTLLLSVTVPSDATGSYYFLYSLKAIEVASSGKDGKMPSGSFAFKMNLFSPGMINVKGRQTHSLKLEKTSIKYSKKTNNLNVITNLANDGNSYLRGVEGFVAIVSAKNEVVGKLELKSRKAQSLRNNLVAKGTKQMIGSLGTSLKTGKYSAIFTFRDEDNKLVKTITEKFEVK